MVNTACVIIAVMVIICYYIIKFAKIPILYKDTIRILLCIVGIIVGIVVPIYSFTHNDYKYLFGFLTAEYIFESFDTSKDK